MKTNLKRSLALVLTVCMLLSVLPFAAFAEDFTETYTYTELFNNLAFKNTGNVKTAAAGYVQKQFQSGTPDNAAFTFENIPSGVYTLEIALHSDNNLANTDVNIAVLTKDEVDALGSGAATATNDLITEKAFAQIKNGDTTLSYTNVIFAGDSNNIYYIGFNEVTDAAKKSQLRIASITLTKTADVYALNGETALTSEQAVIDALAASGNTVKLCRNVDVGTSATLAADSTLDLNSFTLSGTIATLGTVTGTGTISEQPFNVAPGYVALENNGVYDVVKYKVKKDNTAVADGNNVNFWFRVELDADYALAKNDADFKIGVNVTVGENSATAVFDDALVNDWADAMSVADNSAVYFRVTIKDASDISFDLTATVNGNATSTISYAPAAE